MCSLRYHHDRTPCACIVCPSSRLFFLGKQDGAAHGSPIEPCAGPLRQYVLTAEAEGAAEMGRVEIMSAMQQMGTVNEIFSRQQDMQLLSL